MDPFSLPSFFPSVHPSYLMDSFSDMLGLSFLWCIQIEMTNSYKNSYYCLWWGPVKQCGEVQASLKVYRPRPHYPHLLGKGTQKRAEVRWLLQSHNQKVASPGTFLRKIFVTFYCVWMLSCCYLCLTLCDPLDPQAPLSIGTKPKSWSGYPSSSSSWIFQPRIQNRSPLLLHTASGFFISANWEFYCRKASNAYTNRKIL